MVFSLQSASSVVVVYSSVDINLVLIVVPGDQCHGAARRGNAKRLSSSVSSFGIVQLQTRVVNVRKKSSVGKTTYCITIVIYV